MPSETVAAHSSQDGCGDAVLSALDAQSAHGNEGIAAPVGEPGKSGKPGAELAGKDKVPYFRIYDLRSTYATRLSAGGVADEWVTQLLRQGDAKVFKKYSQMKLQMKREALAKLNRQANESGPGFGTVKGQSGSRVLAQ